MAMLRCSERINKGFAGKGLRYGNIAQSKCKKANHFKTEHEFLHGHETKSTAGGTWFTSQGKLDVIN